MNLRQFSEIISQVVVDALLGDESPDEFKLDFDSEVLDIEDLRGYITDRLEEQMTPDIILSVAETIHLEE